MATTQQYKEAFYQLFKESFSGDPVTEAYKRVHGIKDATFKLTGEGRTYLKQLLYMDLYSNNSRMYNGQQTAMRFKDVNTIPVSHLHPDDRIKFCFRKEEAIEVDFAEVEQKVAAQRSGGFVSRALAFLSKK